MLKTYDDMKEEIKIQRLKQFIEDFSLLIKQCLFSKKKKKNQLKIYNYFINMTEEDISQEFRLKKQNK